LNTKNIASVQADLGIEVILALFSKKGLQDLFQVSNFQKHEFSENAKRIFALQDEYVKTIDSVVAFLQGKNPTLALQICQEDFLPEASRFAQLEGLGFWHHGNPR
jgi:RNAse (barnase) inhibitor barstar